MLGLTELLGSLLRFRARERFAMFVGHDFGMNTRGLGADLDEIRSFTLFSSLTTHSSVASRFD